MACNAKIDKLIRKISETNSGAVGTESVIEVRKKKYINEMVMKGGENELLKNKLLLYEAHHREERRKRLMKQVDEITHKIREKEVRLSDYMDSNKNIESIEGVYHKEYYEEEAERHIRHAKRKIQLLKDTLANTIDQLNTL
jgi:HEPN domain-containing protein